MRQNIICFYCNKPTLGGSKTTDRYMLGIDIPYVNLWFHKLCFENIKMDILAYLTENVTLVYNYKDNGDLKKKK